MCGVSLFLHVLGQDLLGQVEPVPLVVWDDLRLQAVPEAYKEHKGCISPVFLCAVARCLLLQRKASCVLLQKQGMALTTSKKKDARIAHLVAGLQAVPDVVAPRVQHGPGWGAADVDVVMPQHHTALGKPVDAWGLDVRPGVAQVSKPELHVRHSVAG